MAHKLGHGTCVELGNKGIRYSSAEEARPIARSMYAHLAEIEIEATHLPGLRSRVEHVHTRASRSKLLELPQQRLEGFMVAFEALQTYQYYIFIIQLRCGFVSIMHAWGISALRSVGSSQ